MFNGLLKELLYAGLDKETFDDVKNDWRKENARNLLIYSSLSLAVFTVLLFIHVATESTILVSVRYYLYMAAFSGIILLCACMVKRRGLPLVLPLAYLLLVGMYFYALLVTGLHQTQPAVFAVALLFAAPFLFTDRPIRMILLTAAVVLGLCLFSRNNKEPEVARLDVWNSVAVGIVTVPIELLEMRHKFKSYAQGRAIRYLSETDVLTGARNRNLYEKHLNTLAAQCRKNMTAVFVDVNGLHNLNDSQGHAAGDAMLRAVARELIAAFGETRVYRIGGDEFVVFCPDRREDGIREEMRRIKETVEKQGYYISVGVVTAEKSEGMDLTAMVSAAEKEMYRDKDEYYRKSGKDRRRR